MNNTIIKASAGSGKTFQLSNRYIELLCRAVPLDYILASTFTRKAAGEISGRILSRLAKAAVEDKAFKELKTFISSCPAAKEPLQKTAAKVAKELYKMRVSTLDSFFGDIATAFSSELGFPPAWKMVDETAHNKIIRIAVGNVLRKSQREGNDAAKKILYEFQKGEAKRGVQWELIQIVQDYIDMFRATKEEHWDSKHQALLKDLLLDNELNALISQLPDAAPTNADGKTIPKLVISWIEKLSDVRKNGNWKDVCGWVQDRKNNDWKFGKSQPARNPKLYEKLACHAAAAEINKIVGITKTTYHLLKLLTREYDRLTSQYGSFYFNDLTEKLRRFNVLIGTAMNDSLNHRLNAPANYLMLDEFQDTSLPQWEILKSFAEKAREASETGKGSVFIVGDTKQAIYGWRGGVAKIFDEVKKTVTDIKPEPLNKSYRSSPVIIAAVNHLFENLNQNAAIVNDDHRDEYLAAVEEFSFQRHETAKTDLPGYVSLIVSGKWNKEEDSDNDEDNEATPYVIDVVDKILQRHKEKPQVKIGVLTRKGDTAKNILIQLRKQIRKENLNTEVEGAGGMLLADSNAVQYILSIMRLADHPGDSAAAFHLANSPLAKTLGLEKDQTSVLVSHKIRKALLGNGYGKTVKQYAEKLFPLCDEREMERLKKLVELSYLFDQEARGVRTQDYITKFEETEVKIPKLAASISVMTIHGSKGLEFDIVVLPELKQELCRTNGIDYIVARSDNNNPAAEIQWVLKHVNKSLQPFLPPEYQEAFKARIKNETYEALCNLYVAMTRAKQELMMILPPGKSDSYQARYSGLLLHCFGADMAALKLKAETGEESVFELPAAASDTSALKPDKDWTLPKRNSETDCERDFVNPVVRANPAKLTITLSPAQKTRHLLRQSPSTLDTNDEQCGASREWRAESEEFVEDRKLTIRYPLSATYSPLLRGTAIHSCFELVQWLDDGRPSDADLRDAILRSTQYAGEAVGDEHVQNVLDNFCRCCEQSEILAALSRKNYNGNVEIETERRFVVKMNDSKKGDYLLRGSIDRLIIGRDGNGEVKWVEILDYKTDREIPSGNHSAQMDAYRAAAAAMFNLPRENIRAKVVYVLLNKLMEN